MSLVRPKEVLLGYGNPSPLAEDYDFPQPPRSCWAAKPPLCKGRCQRQLTEGLLLCSWKRIAKSDYSLSKNRTAHSRMLHTCPAAGEQSPSRVVEKSVNFVFAFGRKAPFTFFLLLSPPNPPDGWASAGTPVKASPLYTKGPLVRCAAGIAVET